MMYMNWCTQEIKTREEWKKQVSTDKEWAILQKVLFKYEGTQSETKA